MNNSTAEENLYIYKAIITKVYDGDTFYADIDLGLGTWRKDVVIRLARVDTPEVRGEEKAEGKLVRDHVRELILDKEVIIKTYRDKKGSFQRLIAEVFIPSGEMLSDYLLENNMAILY